MCDNPDKDPIRESDQVVPEAYARAISLSARALMVAAQRFGVQRAAGMNHLVDRHDVLLLLDAKIAPIQPLRCNAVFGRRAVTAVVVAACYIGLRRQRA